MRVIKNRESSLSAGIPTAVMKLAKLPLDSMVDLINENGCVVIEPVYLPSVDIDALVAGITSVNLHREVGLGAAVGKEVF